MSTKRHRGVIVLSLLIVHIFSVSILYADDLSEGAKIFVETEFNTLDSFEMLPEAVVKYLMDKIDEPISPIGGPFRATDVVITPPDIPSRRLMYLGEANDVFIIWYEHGGRGYHHHVVLLRIKDAEEASDDEDQVTPIFLARPLFNAEDMVELKQRISDGTIQDEKEQILEHGYW